MAEGSNQPDPDSSAPDSPHHDPDTMPTVNDPQGAATTDASPSPSSRSDIHGRFEPGERLGERYRIVGLLGQGGMGEVYRADDLELGQSVALKFLPERVAADPLALDRFRGEVRTARQIAHPNVCRIYDIGQADGHVFISMEYIDGEDLSHVLRRMGRPSKEKALEIARQLCFGLAAAHEAGILHRDLKPANIMIDGRGRVRITDFGLAGLIEDMEPGKERAGTPAYMAPEQLERAEVSLRSDVYSLGLILYEIFTGQRALKAETIAELRDLHKTSSVTTPRSVVDDVDPAVERVILECLEREPGHRPGSVYGILAALPGGDPLAAALAAGETPSPELVANAGARGGLSVRVATMLAICIGAIALLQVFATATWHAPPVPGVVLATRAGEIIRALGYEDPPENTAWGFMENTEYLSRLREEGDTSWSGLAHERPAPILFWHRWSPRSLSETAQLHESSPTLWNPPQTWPGSISVTLDEQGRLVTLQAEHDPEAEPAGEGGGFWEVLLDRAGLTDLDVVEVPVAETPATDLYEIRRWEVRAPESEGGTFLVQAEMIRGRPVQFRMRWGQIDFEEVNANGEDQTSWLTGAASSIGSIFFLLEQLLHVVYLFAAGVLAVRNERAGRGDRSGAVRIGLLMLGLYLLIEIASIRLAEQGLIGSLVAFITGRPLAHGLMHAFHMWLGYLAIEPYVRRIWPRLLVSWMRLMSGRWRDPLVGREVLIGIALGGVIVLGGWAADALSALFDAPNFAPVAGAWQLDNASGPSWMIASIGHVLTAGLNFTMLELMLLLVLRMLTGRTWAALLIVVMLLVVGAPGWFFGVTYAGDIPMPTTLVTSFVYAVVIAVALVRYGLVCALAAHVGHNLLWMILGTLDLRDWYAGSMLAVLAVLGALVAYGVWASVDRQAETSELNRAPPQPAS